MQRRDCIQKEKIMILKNKYGLSSDMYVSKLTDELDQLAGFTTNSIRKHYIFIDDYCRKKSIYAIRVPGGTVGEIRVDETNKVVGIVIDTGYVVKTYPENINVLLQEYVGEEIKPEHLEFIAGEDMGKLINKQDAIDKIKKETLINYSVAVIAEVAERAKQEDPPIYEGDKENQWVRLADVENALNKYLNI